MNKSTFLKMNAEPIPVEFIADEDNKERDLEPSFWFDNRRYYLGDFIRAKSIFYPDYIHALEAEEYYNPLFLEMVGYSEAVNIYMEVQKGADNGNI